MRFVLVLCPLLLSSTVRAEGGRLAIVNLRIDLADAERAQARATIQSSVKKAGLDLVPEVQIEHMQSKAPELFDCFIEDRCRADLGERLPADFLLTGSINKEDAAYVVQLDVFDVQLATVGRREPAACPRCTAQVFEKRLAAVVENAVRAARQAPRGTLVVRTQPPGAEVRIDQRLVGTSNLERVVAAGPHTVELGGRDRSPISMPVEVKPHERAEINVKMTLQEHTPTPPPEHPPSKPPDPFKPDPPKLPGPPPRWRLGLAGAGIAAGLVLIGVGAPLLSFDGQGTCELTAPRRQCPALADTLGSGIGLVVTGGALAIAATGLLVHDLLKLRRARNARLHVAPVLGQTLGFVLGGTL